MSISQETKNGFQKLIQADSDSHYRSCLPTKQHQVLQSRTSRLLQSSLYPVLCQRFYAFLDFFSTSILSLVSSSLSCSHTVREFSPSQAILIVNDAKAIFPAFITGSVTSNTRSPLGRQPLSLEMISSNGKLSSSSLTSIHSFTPLKPSESGNGNVANGCGLNPSVCQIGILLLCNARSIHRLRSRCEI